MISGFSPRYLFARTKSVTGIKFSLSRMFSRESSRGLPPRSCDTFVALPPATRNGSVIFGKNSDRPSTEVQEVIHIEAKDHAPGSKLACTYVEVDQVARTQAVILSKPAWMWGAEMGANEKGVCIGNEAVWTKMQGPEDDEEKLLGMDLLRLGLERSDSAKEAKHVITSLLEKHGQGGTCSDEIEGFTYHNSFLIADQSEAWILETAGKHWAAERITSGVRNISNQLTIRTTIHDQSKNLIEHAQSKGWYKKSQGPFDFAKVYSSGFEETELTPGSRPCGRQLWGTKLLRDGAKGGRFSLKDMIDILRHEPSGICMVGGFASTGSQVSVLPAKGSGAPCWHWLTATANPHQSVFKPFVFTAGGTMSPHTASPDFGPKDPAKVIPRFRTSVDRTHDLWRVHEKLIEALDDEKDAAKQKLEALMALEAELMSKAEADETSISDNMFHDAVKKELEITQ